MSTPVNEVPVEVEAAMDLAGNAVLDKLDPYLDAGRNRFKKIDTEKWVAELLEGYKGELELNPELVAHLINHAQINVTVTW